MLKTGWTVYGFSSWSPAQGLKWLFDWLTNWLNCMRWYMPNTISGLWEHVTKNSRWVWQMVDWLIDWLNDWLCSTTLLHTRVISCNPCDGHGIDSTWLLHWSPRQKVKRMMWNSRCIWEIPTFTWRSFHSTKILFEGPITNNRRHYWTRL